jgi:DNA-binding response OmpR family regulator
MTRVLIVEDDEDQGHYAELVLGEHGYEVQISRTGASARQAVEAAPVDVVLLEARLPDVDGVELCRALRSMTPAAIIFLSSCDTEVAKVLAFDAGADDYVTKPFSVAELAARIRAILRRGQTGTIPSPDRLVSGDLSLDLQLHCALLRGQEVGTTPKEFQLLRLLMSQAGRVVPRDQFLETVWGPNYFGDPNILDVHMSGLRKKLQLCGRADAVRTVRGVGYRLHEPQHAPLTQPPRRVAAG